MKNKLLLFFIIITRLLFSQSEATKLLSHYIKIKSVSGNEKKAGQFIQKICADFGFNITTFSDTDSSYNFCASLLPLKINKPSIVLLNHIDVVPAEEDENWRHKPFSGEIKNDTLYGRGTIDMKGLAVMQIFALKQIKEAIKTDSLKTNFVILFLSGEETGGKNGAEKIIQPEILSQLNPKVVVGEGGGGLTHVVPGKENELCFFVSNAEKKSLWIKLEAKIKSPGHGSVPSSKTADKILLKALEKIESREEKIVIDKNSRQTFRALGEIIGGFKGFIVKHLNWWIFKPVRKKVFSENEALNILVTNSYQLTQIQNPKGPVNQVAQSAYAYYDCRLLPNKSEKPRVLKRFFRILDPRIKLTVVDESPSADPTKLDMHFDNIKTSINKIFPEAHIIPVLFPATTDNSYFRSVDIPSYGFLPFQLTESMMESVHAPNERLPLKAIDDGIKVYSEFLKLYVN